MDSGFLIELKDDFEIETFKTLANFLNDDINHALNSLESRRRTRAQSNNGAMGERIQIFNLFLKKLKHDQKNAYDKSLENFFESNQNSCESITNVFNLLLKLFMKTMSMSEYFNKKLNLSKEQQQQQRQPLYAFQQNNTSLDENRVYFSQPPVETLNSQTIFRLTTNSNNNNVSSDEEDHSNEAYDYKYSDPSTLTSSINIQLDNHQIVIKQEHLNDTDKSSSTNAYNNPQKPNEKSCVTIENNQNSNSTPMQTTMPNGSNQSIYSLNNMQGLFSFTRAPLSNKETTKLKKKVFRRVYHCQICPFSHYGLTYLNQHILKHNYLPGVPKCEYCNYYETSKIKMDNHIKLHLNKNK